MGACEKWAVLPAELYPHRMADPIGESYTIAFDGKSQPLFLKMVVLIPWMKNQGRRMAALHDYSSVASVATSFSRRQPGSQCGQAGYGSCRMAARMTRR